MKDQTARSLPERPNILLILVDQLRYPRRAYGDAGFVDPIKDILDFVTALDDNHYAQHFPGFCKLRKHARVLVDHTIAESACIPSRASIMTGQYGPRSGVTQTDGLFKSGDARNFPWLRANGSPTMGDWFRELGYSTHYFGKWHVSDPPEHTLQGFGFDDWELSWPEPHGALSNNLGTYRDYQFADLACSFLSNRGLGVPYSREVSKLAGSHPEASAPEATRPFLAVCSFTNPHDIAAYPALPRGLTDPKGYGPGDSVPIPAQGTRSVPAEQGSFRLPLNPTGLPQACATASPTQAEDLWSANKPTCQADYAIKLGLGLAAKTGLAVAEQAGGDLDEAARIAAAVAATMKVAVPFQTQDDPTGAGVGFLQYYAYMISMVDRHIERVLDTLERAGLRDDTLVVFASDHGEYGAAHGLMMEKWHTAYQEAVHVPVLFSHPSFVADAVDAGEQGERRPEAPIAVDAQTSHIDILPTLLGYATRHLTATERASRLEAARRNLSLTHLAGPLPGADLSEVILRGSGPVVGPTGKPREGVLFVTDDLITEPLPADADPHNAKSWKEYAVFSAAVDLLRTEPAEGDDRPYFPQLSPGAVPQPCHVRALRSGPWKLVRYCDPWSPVPAADQWELYNLEADPAEACNLVVFDGAFPTLIDDLPAGLGLTPEALTAQAKSLREMLRREEAALLKPYPSAHPSAGGH